MSRYIPRLVLFGALLSLPPTSSNALGLGEIRAISALNQPFQGEIELVVGPGEELAGLKVGLASTEVFARYGFDRPAFLSTFQFTVVRTGDGRALIKISSTRSVAEPFVTLLVEAVWPRGRVLREYTVLLDPPVYMPQQTAPAVVATPQSAPASPGVIERNEAPQAVPPATAAPVSPASSAVVRQPRPVRPAPEQVAPAPEEPAAGEADIASGSYAVQRNDTLSQIAGRVSTGSGISTNKTMLALFRANPQAFSGNINRLRSGSVLRIPDAGEIEALAGMNASAEVSRQNSEWRDGDSTSGPSDAEEGRLRLVAPTQGTDSASAGGSGQNAGSAPAASTPGGNIAPDQNRLAINDVGLAEMQRQQSSEPPAVNTPSDAIPIEEPVVAGDTATPSEALPETSPPPAAVQEPKATPAAKPAAASPPVAQTSLLDQLRQFWWVLVAAGVACGVLVMLLRRRREPGAEEVFADIMPPLTDTGAMRTSRLRAAPTPTQAPSDYEQESGPVVLPLRPDLPIDVAADFPFDETPVTAPVAPPARTRVEEPVAASSRAATARAEQQDVLGEADFHMAYGLYDQAADLVKIAMQREPERRDFKLKLLEIYFVWGNRELFLETAEELYASRGEAAPGEWEKVLIMGKQISPDSPMFAQGAGGVHALDLVDVNLEGGENRVDVDLFAEQDMDAAVGAGDSAPRRAEPSLDFLLDREDDSREPDALSRTQESPTVESPVWARKSASTIVDRIDAKNNFEQTAELSIDDLGLDVDEESMTETGRLDDSSLLERTLTADEVSDTQLQHGLSISDGGDTQRKTRPLRDDELTQLAPSLGSSDRTLRAPAVSIEHAEETGTIYVSDIEQSPGDTVEQKRPGRFNSDTAELRIPYDAAEETLQQSGVFGDETVLGESTIAGLTLNTESPELSEDVDFDLSATSTESNDAFATMLNEAVSADKDSGDATALEPLTMSEVGTKLDLARAYMDMGDPDGARSILEEVLQEGNATQQQEAQQLLESVR